MYKDAKEFVRSKSFQGVIIGILIAVVALLIFQAGMFVGYHKATFSYRFGDNYHRVFGDRDFGPSRMLLRGGGFIDAHGAAGRIVAITLPTFVVADSQNTEQIVRVNDTTTIRRFEESIASADLNVDDFVVVLGSPNEESEIEATLIRILPPPGENDQIRLRMRK